MIKMKDKMSERLYDIVKCGSMTKRSQNKKRFTPVNYKTRWFELTKHFLSYFDVENVEVSLLFFILFIYFIFDYLLQFMQGSSDFQKAYLIIFLNLSFATLS